MYNTATRKRRGHRNSIFAPSFGNIITEILNAPLHEVVKDEPKRFTRPATNIVKKEGGFDLVLALPGLTKDHVNIDVDKNKLTIKSVETDEKDETTYRLREFNYANFNRVFTLQEGADIDNISASFDNGILTISIPTHPDAGPKKVNIG